MPELPEVQTVVDRLGPVVAGCRIARVEVLRSDVVCTGRIERNRAGMERADTDLEGLIRGKVVERVRRRAKRIVFDLRDGVGFYVHLGMTGDLEVGGGERASHTHVVWHLEGEGGARELRFSDARRFGRIVIRTAESEDDLGPEPLEMGAGDLAARLAGARRPIKSALMDQGVIAGLGNIYVDESLFAAGIHPLSEAGKLDGARVAELMRAIRRILRAAIKARGSTLRDYRGGEYQGRHRVYGREGEGCRRCRGRIERVVLGGRSTHFCPECQG
jgi:formamidopyrimidine-DNA glycosylase